MRAACSDEQLRDFPTNPEIVSNFRRVLNDTLTLINTKEKKRKIHIFYFYLVAKNIANYFTIYGVQKMSNLYKFQDEIARLEIREPIKG